MDSYPPGVSGNEDAFGPQSEETYEAVGQLCPHCENLVNTTITRTTWNYTVEDWMECPECGEESIAEVEVEEPDHGDPFEIFDFYGSDY
jgi:hypothetical protein